MHTKVLCFFSRNQWLYHIGWFPKTLTRDSPEPTIFCILNIWVNLKLPWRKGCSERQWLPIAIPFSTKSCITCRLFPMQLQLRTNRSYQLNKNKVSITWLPGCRDIFSRPSESSIQRHNLEVMICSNRVLSQQPLRYLSNILVHDFLYISCLFTGSIKRYSYANHNAWQTKV